MTLRQFRAGVAKHGCTADIVYIGRLGNYDVIVDSPQGKYFRGTGTHCLVHHTLTGDTEGERARVREEAYQDLLNCLPLEDCLDAECDVCHPPEEVES